MDDAGELRENLGKPRKTVMLHLYREGEVRSSELREEAGFPVGSKEHHFNWLRERDLIEVAGRTNVAGGIAERIWRLTDEGRTFTEEWILPGEDNTPRPRGVEPRLDRIERQIDELQDQQEEHDQTTTNVATTSAVNKVEEQVDELRNEVHHTIEPRLDDIEERVADHDQELDDLAEAGRERDNAIDDLRATVEDLSDRLGDTQQELNHLRRELQERDRDQERGDGGLFSLGRGSSDRDES